MDDTGDTDTDKGDDDDDDDDDDDSDGDDDDDDDASDVEPIYLSPSEHLIHISMTLRGTQPSTDEVTTVEEDPDTLEGIVDSYLESPNFSETIHNLHNDTLLILIDYFVFPADFLPRDQLADIDPYMLNHAVTEAPLQLIEHIVMDDRPYTEIVTADYTMANGITSVI